MFSDFAPSDNSSLIEAFDTTTISTEDESSTSGSSCGGAISAEDDCSVSRDGGFSASVVGKGSRVGG